VAGRVAGRGGFDSHPLPPGIHRVLCKYPDQNPVISRPFDTGKFVFLYKKQYSA